MSQLQRIAQGRSATLTHTFYSDGVAADPIPDSATYTITRADGTTLATGSATEAGTGKVTVTLTPAQTALLDTLTVTWTATFGGQSQSFADKVEVAGEFLFSLAEARALAPLDDTVKYPTAALVAMRTTVEEAIELEYGTAVVPRYTLEPRRMRDGMIVTRTPLRALRSLSYTTAGVTTAYTSAQLAALTLEDWAITGAWGWGCRTSQVTVGYEYGLDTPPGRLRQAAVRLARQWLVSGPVDDRALGAASPDGNFSFGLATPGRGGSVFGLPELDSIVMSSPYRVMVA
jgi:hypothetical protein